MDFSICFNYFSIVLLVISVCIEEGGTFGSYRKKKCLPFLIRKGNVRIRNRGRLARINCLPGYQLYGERMVFCEDGVWVDRLPSCIKAGCSSFKSLVTNGQVLETYSGAVAQTYCLKGYKLSGSSTLTCDGVSWNGTIPSCFAEKKELAKSCDFENDSNELCDWVNDLNDEFNWKRQSMATPSGHAGTGPEYDHTLGKGLNGHYLFIEASNRKIGDTARLKSPYFPPVSENDTNCFTFWYHMYGAHIGSLNVYVNNELVFTETRNHGNRWIRATIPINYTSPFQVVIEGSRGFGFAGDIAVDDLKLSEGFECLQEQTNTTEITLPGSCVGRCGDNSTTLEQSCYCHDECHINSTCCDDIWQVCGGDQASYFKESTSFVTQSTVIGIILAVLTIVVIMTTVVYFVRMRRFTRNSNVDDDADVQFLTSDEMINFNMARPSPDRFSGSHLQNLNQVLL